MEGEGIFTWLSPGHVLTGIEVPCDKLRQAREPSDRGRGGWATPMSKHVWRIVLMLSGGCCINPAYGEGTGGAEAPADDAEAVAPGDAAAGPEADPVAAPNPSSELGWEAQLKAAVSLDRRADPVKQLESIPGRIQTQIDVVMQPITDANQVIADVQSMPQRLGINAGELKVAAKASLEAASVQVDFKVGGQAQAEVHAILEKIKGMGTGLKEMPKRAQVAVKNVVSLGAQATKMATKIQAKANAGRGKKAEANKANAQVAAALLNQVEGQVTEAKTTLMGLPAKATQTLARLTASFST